MPLLDALVCPAEAVGALRPRGEELECQQCGARYPLREGIPVLLAPAPDVEDRLALVDRERRQRDREADDYDRLPGLRLMSPREIPATLNPLGLGRASRLLEVGCGTGRLTLPARRRGAQVLAVDHSLESLLRLRQKLAGAEAAGVQLVQAEAFRLPVRSGWATHGLAAQMLEHVPSPALRSRVLAELARALEAGGRAAVSAYRTLPWLAREGMHSGEMYFRRFTRAEFQGLLEPHFRVERLSGGLLYAWLAHGTRP
ncbi:MAG: methyltransferase domain-containing protein [Armatimonadetes bacterium]|nr:methyltransferase domain-containing protein [Armatimonadota bacterium]